MVGTASSLALKLQITEMALNCASPSLHAFGADVACESASPSPSPSLSEHTNSESCTNPRKSAPHFFCVLNFFACWLLGSILCSQRADGGEGLPALQMGLDAATTAPTATRAARATPGKMQSCHVEIFASSHGQVADESHRDVAARRRNQRARERLPTGGPGF